MLTTENKKETTARTEMMARTSLIRKMMEKDGGQRTIDWKAKKTGNPLADAFDEKISVHPGIGSAPVAPEEVDRTLASLVARPRTLRTSAYLHVPYCETRCLYCMFYNKPYRTPEESKVFTDHLVREMSLWSDKAVHGSEPVHAVYFGGGTPTVLEAGDIERIFRAVRRYLPLANDCEITFEGSLSHFTKEKMDASIAGGANRFSLGVQTFDTKTRQAVGRLSSKEELISQLRHLMAYNQAAVVVDLIYGFPYQTMETWEEDLQIVEDLKLDGVDCYQLRVFPGSPLHKYIANGKLPAGPDHELRTRMFAKCVEILGDLNWKRISISHWARTMRERNFYNYYAKTRSDCLAFGPGAGGVIHGYSYMNERKVEEWMRKVDEGKKPVAMLLTPPKHWHLNRAISEHMELNYLNPGELAEEFSPALAQTWAPVLENWTDAGLMARRGDFYHLTLAGQFWQTRMTQLLMDTAKGVEVAV